MPKMYQYIFIAISALALLVGLTLAVYPDPPILSNDGRQREGVSNFIAGGRRCEASVISLLSSRERTLQRKATCREAQQNYILQVDGINQARRAADAADATAVLAFSQTKIAAWGLLLGGITMAAAIAAAWFAKGASEAARNTLQHDRWASSQQIRPWLMYKDFKTEINRGKNDEFIGLRFNITVVNAGSMPAQFISMQKTAWISDDINAPDIDFTPYLNVIDQYGTCAQGVNYEVQFDPISPQLSQDILQRKRRLLLNVYIEYAGPSNLDRPYSTVITRELFPAGIKKQADGEDNPWFKSGVIGELNYIK